MNNSTMTTKTEAILKTTTQDKFTFVEFIFDDWKHRAYVHDDECIAEEWDEDDWLPISLSDEDPRLVALFVRAWDMCARAIA